jgi:hypothetical protein
VNKQNYQYWDVNNPINLHEWPKGEREFCKLTWTLHWEKWRPPKDMIFKTTWLLHLNWKKGLFIYAKEIKYWASISELFNFENRYLPSSHPVHTVSGDASMSHITSMIYRQLTSNVNVV